MKKTLKLLLLYFIIIMYLELWHKVFFYPNIWNIGLLYTSLFTLLISLILTFLSSLGKAKTNKIVIVSFISILTFIFTGNYIYTTLFSIPFSIQVTSMAGGALDFIGIFFSTLGKNIANVMILCFPLICLLCNLKKIKFDKVFYFEKKSLTYAIFATYALILLVLLPLKNTSKSAYKLYWKENDLISSINMFGFITAERLEIQRLLFHFEESLAFEEKDTSNETKEEYNKQEIDFESLIANEKDENIKSVYSYFSNATATKKNEYTGMFEGKNLIFILAESFNSVVVDEKLTPTLYKLIHSGFHFNNFYSPVFLSTTGGEFQSMTALIPSADTISEWHKGEAYLPYSLGNILSKEGYTTNAFHNWEYDFYERNKTMPELGFPNFLACENGLEKIADCEWQKVVNAPEDIKMIQATYPKYKDQNKFMTYYITMSGHAPYSLTPDKRYYDLVKDLPYSDNTKAYVATQIDLDRAVKALIDNLEKDGILDDTVICLVGDHYPYALDISNINELSSYKRDETFEIHHSDLIIWNNNQEVVEINKVGSEIDILPTLLNLFGIEFDSRLMIGKDLLSDAEGFALFSDLSWKTDKGSYSSKTKKFEAKESVDSDYVNKMNQWVNNSIIVSKKMITNDIYRKIFGNGE